MIPAAARGVSRPAANNRPAPSSVAQARRACSQPLRIPMLSNHRAVPGSFPPPNSLFKPCAMTVSPIVALSTQQTEVGGFHGERLSRGCHAGRIACGVQSGCGGSECWENGAVPDAAASLDAPVNGVSGAMVRRGARMVRRPRRAAAADASRSRSPGLRSSRSARSRSRSCSAGSSTTSSPRASRTAASAPARVVGGCRSRS